MKKLLVAALVCGVAAAAVYIVARFALPLLDPDGSGGSPAVRVLARAQWDSYNYQLREGPRERTYNLPVVITTQAGAQPNVRIVLDLQDQANYYFVEFTASHTRIGKVESGLETPLGFQGSAGLVSPVNRVVIKRRYEAIEVVLNDVVVARAEDESFQRGSFGAGVLDGSATVKLETPQPCPPFFFKDDFMKTSAEGGSWKPLSGSWHLATLDNPSLSSNAFYYVGSASREKAPAPGGFAPAAAAVRGEWFWDNYRFRVAAVSFGTADVGILFYHRDPDNCYLFRWNAAKQPDGGKARKQLVKRWHGAETLLAEAPGGYQPGVWYQLEAEAVGNRIRVIVDGHELFRVTDPTMCFGQVGLYTAVPAPAETHFDDVAVDSVRWFGDDFSVASAGRWRPLGGSWEQHSDEGGAVFAVTADAPAKALAGTARWGDYAFSAGVRLPQQVLPATEVGLVSHYLDETNYALFAWQPASGVVRIEAKVEGKQVVKEHAIAHRAPPATRHNLAVEWRGPILTARLDGQAVLNAWVPGLPRGAWGLYAAAVRQLAFDDAQTEFPLPPEPVLTTHRIFSHERTMEVWAGAANDWEAAQETLDGASAELYWHRADFRGDTTMEIVLDGDDKKERERGEARERRRTAPADRRAPSCRMVLAAEPGKGALSGYNFLLTWPDPAKGQTTYDATITRAGAVAAQRKLAFGAKVSRLRFERYGPYVIASVNDDPILAAKDSSPLQGRAAAFGAIALPVEREDVTVFADTVRVYTFSKASSDWRPAAGTWETRNRWQCDPRWSFFSGVPDGKSLAAIWNKLAFDGDVSVEFAVGPKMEASSSNYSYTRDYNVTICADGKDLTTGYSFIFGGWDNSLTAITRGKTIVARSSDVIPVKESIHRRWFYIKVEKVGNTLNFYRDGARVLTYTDPQPLTGNRVALWTWGHGIMVARVRISASSLGPAEPPGTPPGPCPCIYSP